ncbi:pentapeptide repeat-containing protein [Paraburkholderia bonniea]|uniref:pentapeptide repeat-containing protein n=1 Tax=Paraburkholderia bonniea TaxID=2152891 RepID=UPI001C2C4FA4|nr:pentapeptide repeat-containing protein [Paraburkholderia bonniea]
MSKIAITNATPIFSRPIEIDQRTEEFIHKNTGVSTIDLFLISMFDFFNIKYSNQKIEKATELKNEIHTACASFIEKILESKAPEGSSLHHSEFECHGEKFTVDISNHKNPLDNTIIIKSKNSTDFERHTHGINFFKVKEDCLITYINIKRYNLAPNQKIDLSRMSWDFPGDYYLKDINLTKTQFPKDLKNANLSNLILSGVDLSGVDLTGANLTGADLTGADLTGANLTGAKLTGANLTGAICRSAIFRNADLARTKLSHADFSNTNLENCSLPSFLPETLIFFGTEGDKDIYIQNLINNTLSIINKKYQTLPVDQKELSDFHDKIIINITEDHKNHGVESISNNLTRSSFAQDIYLPKNSDSESKFYLDDRVINSSKIEACDKAKVEEHINACLINKGFNAGQLALFHRTRSAIWFAIQSGILLDGLKQKPPVTNFSEFVKKQTAFPSSETTARLKPQYVEQLFKAIADNYRLTQAKDPVTPEQETDTLRFLTDPRYIF